MAVVGRVLRCARGGVGATVGERAHALRTVRASQLGGGRCDAVHGSELAGAMAGIVAWETAGAGA